MNVSSDSIKYKRLVLAVKHGSAILGAPCGKGHYFSVRGRHLRMRMKVFLGMLKIGPANPCNNKLIWSGLTYKLLKLFIYTLTDYTWNVSDVIARKCEINSSKLV